MNALAWSIFRQGGISAMSIKQALQNFKKAAKNIRHRLPTRKFLLKMAALLPGYVFARLNQALKIMPKNSKNIFFILDDQRFYSMGDGNTRYLYAMLYRFSEAGYNVYFYKKINLRIYYRLEMLGRLIFQLRNLKIVSKLPADTENFIFAFDRVDENLLRKKWKKLVYINMFKPPFCQVGNIVWIPYSMFPCVYSTGQNKSLGVYRENTRKLKILFAGNTKKTYYNNSRLKIRYNQLTRIEAVNTLSELRDNVKFTEGKE